MVQAMAGEYGQEITIHSPLIIHHLPICHDIFFLWQKRHGGFRSQLQGRSSDGWNNNHLYEYT